MAEREIIDPDNFPSNTNKQKEERKLQKVIKGDVKIQKPSFFRKALSSIFADDLSEDDIRNELIFDYLVPTVKNTLNEMGKMLLDALFFGSMKPRAKSGNSPVKVSYSNYYDNKSSSTATSRTSYNFDEYAFNSRQDAEDALDQLIDLTKNYGAASVADFCDVIGVTSNFTDNKYGWTDLIKVTISRTRDGYIINFPKPSPLSK